MAACGSIARVVHRLNSQSARPVGIFKALRSVRAVVGGRAVDKSAGAIVSNIADS
jgi:hypothetical protein